MIAGQFRLTKRLGAGSMGEVWRATDVTLEREVAIKSLRGEFASNRSLVDRFRTEAVALARLHHPNIASLYTLVRDGDTLYMVMEFVPGSTLDQLLAARKRLPWQEVRGIALKALAGLGHAHAIAVVHRDVKPANIMITPGGDLKLTDFGIARILDRSRMTRTGSCIGTMAYASPEQVRGTAVDGRSDQYSLAIVLYELLTGELPFKGNNDYQLMRAQLETPPPHAGTRVPGLPKAFETALLRAMAKSPEARFADAADFARALESIADSGVIPSTAAARRWPRLEVGSVVARLASLASPSSAHMNARWRNARPVARMRDLATAIARWSASTSIVDSPRVARAIAWVRENAILAAALGIAIVAIGLVLAALRPAPGWSPARVFGGASGVAANGAEVVPASGASTVPAPSAAAPNPAPPAPAPAAQKPSAPPPPPPSAGGPTTPSPGSPPQTPPATPSPGSPPLTPPSSPPKAQEPTIPVAERPSERRRSEGGWYVRR